MSYRTIANTPPVPGTTTQTWEGYARADELLPCDVIVQTGERIEALVRRGRLVTVVVNGGETEGTYFDDDVLYVERTVKLTVSLGD
jgi:hypothetical protein